MRAPQFGFRTEEQEQRRVAGTCLRKVRHQSRLAANLAVSVMGSRAKGTKVYRCAECDGWHIGHPNPLFDLSAHHAQKEMG